MVAPNINKTEAVGPDADSGYQHAADDHGWRRGHAGYGQERIFDGQIYALGMGETVMIKRLENIVGGRVRIIAENGAEFPPYEADARDIRIIRQVIWFARELVPRE